LEEIQADLQNNNLIFQNLNDNMDFVFNDDTAVGLFSNEEILHFIDENPMNFENI
jgi:hypothetical protein